MFAHLFFVHEMSFLTCGFQFSFRGHVPILAEMVVWTVRSIHWCLEFCLCSLFDSKALVLGGRKFLFGQGEMFVQLMTNLVLVTSSCNCFNVLF